MSATTDIQIADDVRGAHSLHPVVTPPCPNCKETVKECGCMRNKCLGCGKPVGNITFTYCDECWDKSEPPDH